MEIIQNEEMIAYCGLYCGSCSKYLKGKCPGCKENEKAAWCKIRQCCRDTDRRSCAECKDFAEVKECKKYDNTIARVIEFVSRTDRSGCISFICQNGYSDFAREMTKKGKMSMPKVKKSKK